MSLAKIYFFIMAFCLVWGFLLFYSCVGEIPDDKCLKFGEEKNLFKYRDKAKVVSGFYANTKTEILEMEFSPEGESSSFPYHSCFKFSYKVKTLEGSSSITFWVPEHALTKIEESYER